MPDLVIVKTAACRHAAIAVMCPDSSCQRNMRRWDGEETFFSGTITGCSMEAEEERVYKVRQRAACNLNCLTVRAVCRAICTPRCPLLLKQEALVSLVHASACCSPQTVWPCCSFWAAGLRRSLTSCWAMLRTASCPPCV